MRYDFDKSFLEVYMPYCIQKQDSGNWVVLNRDYKPLGTLDNTWVDYAPHEVKTHLKGDTFYLYSDGTKPQNSAANAKAYFDKLRNLFEVRIKAKKAT